MYCHFVLTGCYFLGVKLLSKMGWRHGRSLKESSINSLNGTLLESDCLCKMIFPFFDCGVT